MYFYSGCFFLLSFVGCGRVSKFSTKYLFFFSVSRIVRQFYSSGIGAILSQIYRSFNLYFEQNLNDAPTATRNQQIMGYYNKASAMSIIQLKAQVYKIFSDDTLESTRRKNVITIKRQTAFE